MESQAIIRRPVNARNSLVQLKVAQHISHKPREGEIYCPKLGMPIKLPAKTFFGRLIEGTKERAHSASVYFKGIAYILTEDDSSTRIVEVSQDELFGKVRLPPTVKNKQPEL